MTPCSCRFIIIALITSLTLPAWGQKYQLYVPQSVTADQKILPKDGVLVQEIVVKKGDSLYELSRKFNGNGMYYPQILLFNSIKKPRLIYPGDTLKIPVAHNKVNDAEHADTKPKDASHKRISAGDKKTSAKPEADSQVQQTRDSSSVSAPTTEISLSDLKTVETGKNRVSRHKKTSVTHTKKSKSHAHASTAVAPPPSTPAAVLKEASDAASGQRLFESAVKAYRRDDCRTALELLDRYLADNSGSPLAADATLYKADCYLKLSVQ
ncbi:MAG: LysM peptidoglycan-binding domain-containing protein [Desulfuromonadaceae bacterium]|nr:LysM peptidoglycan-binding domain-containing protein [Desulfuromonadaceae bacterium]